MTDTAPELGPAATRLADLVRAVPDDRLDDPTPCPDYTVAALLDHVEGFALAFIDAAEKVEGRGGPAPVGAAARLADGWRERIPDELDALAAAWRDPGASEGNAVVGGLEMPAPVVGLVALEELVVHGWDLAAATGRAYDPTPAELDAVQGFFAGFPDDPEARGEAFGRVVPVAADAPTIDRVIAASGRDPGWSPGATSR
jgi:uncharacterized protein (TIGR03086 family)